MRFLAFWLVCILLLGSTRGQYFDLEQVSQLYRPRIVCDAAWNAPSHLADTGTSFSSLRTGFSGSFPLRTKLGVNFSPDFSSLKFKDILKNSVKVKASQLMAGFRIGYGQVTPGFALSPQQNIGYASASILGLHLDSRYRVLFYSIGLGISEASLQSTVPMYSGIIGRMHLRSLRKMYFYGIALAGSGGVPIPVPFIGGAFPVARSWSFRVSLPVSMELRYQRKGFVGTGGIRLTGMRTGLILDETRMPLTYAGLQYGISMEQKLGKQIQLFVCGGYVTPGQVTLGKRSEPEGQYRLVGSPFLQGGVRMYFGRSIWGNMLQKLEME